MANCQVPRGYVPTCGRMEPEIHQLGPSAAPNHGSGSGLGNQQGTGWLVARGDWGQVAKCSDAMMLEMEGEYVWICDIWHLYPIFIGHYPTDWYKCQWCDMWCPTVLRKTKVGFFALEFSPPGGGWILAACHPVLILVEGTCLRKYRF